MVYKFKNILFILAFLLIMACRPISNKVSDEEYQVFSAVLNYNFMKYDDENAIDENVVTFSGPDKEGYVSVRQRTKTLGKQGLEEKDILEIFDKIKLKPGENYQKYAMRFEKFRKGIKNKTIDDFIRKVKQPSFVEPLFDGNIKADIIPEKKVKDEDKNFWKNFDKKYGSSQRAIVSFSRVGFNPSKSQAIVYFDYLYGPLWGHGMLLYLEKQQGKWKVMRYLVLWVS